MLALFIVVSPCSQAGWRSMKSTEELQSKTKLEMIHLLQSLRSHAPSHSVFLSPSLSTLLSLFFFSDSTSLHISVIFTGLKFLLIFSHSRYCLIWSSATNHPIIMHCAIFL